MIVNFHHYKWLPRRDRYGGNGARAALGAPDQYCGRVLDNSSLLVLGDVIFNVRRYFRELQAGSIEGIATNILADCLSRLVAVGIFSREDSVREALVRESPTEAGIRTLPIIFSLVNWRLDWRDGTPKLRIRQELMDHKGHRFINDFMGELRVQIPSDGESAWWKQWDTRPEAAGADESQPGRTRRQTSRTITVGILSTWWR